MYRFVEDHKILDFEVEGAHYCGPTRLGQYKMCKYWIDTDNKVWSEPTRLYTTTEPYVFYHDD